MLIDSEKGRGLAIRPFETEGDLRKGDETLNSMSPADESLHETRQADYFSEERSYVAAATYARLQTSADLRRALEPLAEAARRLASDLDGQERRQAEELWKSLEKLLRRAN